MTDGQSSFDFAFVLSPEFTRDVRVALGIQQSGYYQATFSYPVESVFGVAPGTDGLFHFGPDGKVKDG